MILRIETKDINGKKIVSTFYAIGKGRQETIQELIRVNPELKLKGFKVIEK